MVVVVAGEITKFPTLLPLTVGQNIEQFRRLSERSSNFTNQAGPARPIDVGLSGPAGPDCDFSDALDTYRMQAVCKRLPVRRTHFIQGKCSHRNQTEYNSGRCPRSGRGFTGLVRGIGSTGGSEISDVPVDIRVGCRHPDIAAKSKTLFSKCIRLCKGISAEFPANFQRFIFSGVTDSSLALNVFNTRHNCSCLVNYYSKHHCRDLTNFRACRIADA